MGGIEFGYEYNQIRCSITACQSPNTMFILVFAGNKDPQKGVSLLHNQPVALFLE